MAAATSTGGLTGKRWGRIGDSPIIGAGTYADDRGCAVSATGAGEYFIRVGVAHEICAQIRFRFREAIREAQASVANDAEGNPTYVVHASEFALDRAEIQAIADGVIAEMAGLGGSGGVIVATPWGDGLYSFNTPGMYRGMASPAGRSVAIYGDEMNNSSPACRRGPSEGRGGVLLCPIQYPSMSSGCPLRARAGSTVLAVSSGLRAALPSPAAAAWWEYGHETVARIAWLSVDPHTRAEIGRLMARSRAARHADLPAATIEQASIWPDCIKTLGDRFSYASPWHYQNVDVCRPFDPASACRDGNCVSAQIERNLRLLADRTLPVRERLMALSFLVHFMGDLHQPMHAGDHGDLGGNRVAVSYGLIAGRTNLHMVWDGYLAERAISTPAGGAAGHTLRARRGRQGGDAPGRRRRLGARELGDQPRLRLWHRRSPIPAARRRRNGR